jgi:hypothetical protein
MGRQRLAERGLQETGFDIFPGALNKARAAESSAKSSSLFEFF